MKSKLNKVFAEVVKVAGNKLTRFQAAEVAEGILKRNPNLENALYVARNPFNVNGNLSW